MKTKIILLILSFLYCNYSFCQSKNKKKSRWIKFFYTEKQYFQNERDIIRGSYLTNNECPSDTINVLIRYGQDISFNEFIERIKLKFDENSSRIENYLFNGCTVPKFYKIYHFDAKNFSEYSDETSEKSVKLISKLKEEGKNDNEISLASLKFVRERKEKYNYYNRDNWLMTLRLDGNKFLIHTKSKPFDSFDEKYNQLFSFKLVEYNKNNRKNSKGILKSITGKRINSKSFLKDKLFKLTLNNYPKSTLISFRTDNGSTIINEITNNNQFSLKIDFTKESGYSDEDFIIEDFYYKDDWLHRQFKIVSDNETNEILLLEKLKSTHSIYINMPNDYVCIGKLVELESIDQINKNDLLNFSIIMDTPNPNMSNPSGKVFEVGIERPMLHEFVSSIYYGDYKTATESIFSDNFRYLHNYFLIKYSEKYRELLSKSAVYREYTIQTTNEYSDGYSSLQAIIDYTAWMEPKFASKFIDYSYNFSNFGYSIGMSKVVDLIFAKYSPEDAEFKQLYNRIFEASRFFKN